MVPDALPSEGTPAGILPNAPPAFFPWYMIGIAGSAFLFVAATHLPDQLKFPVISTVGLALLAGWGCGRLGRSWRIPFRQRHLVVIGITLVGAQLLAAWKTHQDRVRFLKEKWEKTLSDPMSEAIRQNLTTPVDGETAEQRTQRLDLLQKFEADEAAAQVAQARRLQFTTFLAGRMERSGFAALTRAPWPLVVWCGEVLVGAVLGALLAGSLLKNPVTPH
jgi:hypothetical protein